MLAGCTPKPEQPYFFLQREEHDENGNSITWTYSSNRPPPAWERTGEDDGSSALTQQ